jgi:putative thioredoxin
MGARQGRHRQRAHAGQAFRSGQVVAEFLGALPEARVRAFLDPLLPSTADSLVARAESALEARKDRVAERLLREALAERPDHPGALLGLGALLMRTGSADDAAELLGQIPRSAPEGQQAQAMLAQVSFAREAATQAPADEAREALKRNPEDLDAHWAAGYHAAAGGDYGGALEHFLWLVQHDRAYKNDGGRRAMLSVFEALGPDDPLALDYRSRLASALY